VNLSAAALRLMAEKGLTLQDVAEIVAANEKGSDRTNAERQARHRAKKNAHGQSNGVTVTGVTAPPNDIDILTPQSPPNVISSEITPPIEISDPELQPEHVVEVWNEIAAKHGLAQVKKITPERRKKLRTFIRRHTIDDITEAIAAIPRSPFLLGQNQRGWQASFDWFLEPRNLTKLTEGTYVH
jgi:hypothetical protein